MDLAKNRHVQNEYISRVNRVQDYIEENIAEDFSLEKLSQVAHFSPYHFHRIFSALTGEPLFQYIQRVRLEKAAFLLMANVKKPLAEIAFDCGFSNQASFSRAFKNHFNVSPGKLRRGAALQISKECKTNSKPGQDFSEIALYNQIVAAGEAVGNAADDVTPVSVNVQSIPPMYVIYVRHTGPYQKNVQLFASLFEKLCRWADARELTSLPGACWLTVYHTDPEVTSEDKLRISVCMTVPENTRVEGEIGAMTIAGGKYAIARFKLQSDQYQSAWNHMFGVWLPQSGYQPDDRFSMELYPARQEQDEYGRHTVDIYIPVKPL